MKWFKYLQCSKCETILGFDQSNPPQWTVDEETRRELVNADAFVEKYPQKDADTPPLPPYVGVHPIYKDTYVELADPRYVDCPFCGEAVYLFDTPKEEQD